MRNTIPKITLTEEDQTALIKDINFMIAEGEDFHQTWPQLHNLYLKQYLCEPKFKTRSWPWEKASNLFLPLARVIQDAILSQLHDAMFASDTPMKLIGLEGDDVLNAELLSVFYSDYVWKQLMPLAGFGNLWNFNTCLDGTSCILPRWSRNQSLKRTRNTQTDPVIRQIPGPMLLETPTFAEETLGYNSTIVEDVIVQRDERPFVDLVDLNNLYISPDTALGCNPIDSLQWPNCRYYFMKIELSPEKVVEKKRLGWDNIDETLLNTFRTPETSEQTDTAKENESLSPAVLPKTTPMYEIYMHRVLPAKYDHETSDGKKVSKKQKFDDEDGYAEDIIVRFWGITRKIANITPLQRVCSKRPHILNWFNALPHRIYGQGVQAKMTHLNEWANSSVNQMVDYGTLQNLPYFFYVPHLLTGILPDLTGIQPGQGIPVNDPRAVSTMKLNGDQAFWLNNLQVDQQWAERDGNVSDQTVGRMSEKSANKTARGMAIVQQNANMVFGRLAYLMSQSYAELFRSVHNLYARHPSDEIVFKVLGKTQRLSPDAFKQDLDFLFMINPNRQAEVQVNQNLFQLMMSIPYIMQNPMSVRALTKQLYDSIGSGMGRRNFNEIWPEEMNVGIIQQQQQEIMQGAGPQMQPQGMSPPQGMPSAPMPPPGGNGGLPSVQDLSAMFNKSTETDDENSVKLS